MARPLPTSDLPRGGSNSGNGLRPADESESATLALEAYLARGSHAVGSDELDTLRAENAQLRGLCAELEQALQEAAHGGASGEEAEARIREYETLLEEKSETIRTLHQQIQQLQAAVKELEGQKGSQGKRGHVPVPREEELLNLSEELERERRQLQEDEQSLMEQMREMEVSMARERAEMARLRNDLQRLQAEIRHELDRLERHGAVHDKLKDLKARLQDVTNRRGSAPPQSAPPPPQQAPPPQAAPPQPPSRGNRWFGGR